MIVDLTLPPGAQISKDTIALHFGVSHTPVREALLRLEDEGLVQIFPQSRTIVSTIDVQHAREAHFLRLGVEVEVMKQLVPAITDDRVQALAELIAAQEAALAQGDLDRFTMLDNAFHAECYDQAGVAGLWDIIHTRRAHLDRLRRLHLPVGDKASTVLAQHRRILDACRRRDVGGAETAVREHLRGTLGACDELREHFPEYFH